jgi:hypothetical protein
MFIANETDACQNNDQTDMKTGIVKKGEKAIQCDQQIAHSMQRSFEWGV